MHKCKQKPEIETTIGTVLYSLERSSNTPSSSFRNLLSSIVQRPNDSSQMFRINSHIFRFFSTEVEIHLLPKQRNCFAIQPKNSIYNLHRRPLGLEAHYVYAPSLLSSASLDGLVDQQLPDVPSCRPFTGLLSAAYEVGPLRWPGLRTLKSSRTNNWAIFLLRQRPEPSMRRV